MTILDKHGVPMTTGKQSIKYNTDGTAGAVIRSQEIDAGHMDNLKEEYDNSAVNGAGDLHRACSVPTEVINHWLTEGFDAMQEPIAVVMKRLRADGLDSFITTKKVI